MPFRVFLAVWLIPSFLFVAGAESKSLQYVAVGDSYTIGTGVDSKYSWPSQLTQRLSESGIDIKLTANLAKGGWTSQDGIDRELPLLKNLTPDIVTLLIGVNDWIQGVTSREFTRRLRELMGGIQNQLNSRGNLLVVTIPDFSCSPAGKTWGYGKSATNGITRLNTIIKSEAASRQLRVVEIYPLSQEVCRQSGMFSEDGLHPSPAQYSKWVDLIFPAAIDLLKH